MKKTVVISLGALFYIRGLVTGYFSPVRGQRMFATAVLYITMHYVTISWRETIHKHGRYIAIYMILLTGAIFYTTTSVWLSLSALLRHMAIGSVVYSLEEVLTNRRIFRVNEYFSTGGVLFSIFFTLSFITAFLGRNQTFTLSCDEIYDASHAVIRYTEKTFHVGVQEIEIFQRTILGDMVDSAAVSGSLAGTGMTQTGMAATGISIPTAESAITDSGVDDESFFALLQTYRQQLIDETIANQTDVNQKVCQVFIDQIKDLYQKPGVKVSVILLMFLVISPLLRITLLIISAINRFIFALLKNAKAYTLGKEMKEVDKIV